MDGYVAVYGWVFAAFGWTLAAAFAFLFFLSLGVKQERRDTDGLSRYFEKRLKEIAHEHHGTKIRAGGNA